MSETVITNPTYMEHIRHFFEEEDLEHMAEEAIDLSTYPKLKDRSPSVYLQTIPQDNGDPPKMPPPRLNRPWSAERTQTFRNWINNRHPFGKAVPQQPQTGDVSRIRKDASELDNEEEKDNLNKLKKAFQELMDRDLDDPTSYFALAGVHWYPAPSRCLHGEDRYNPWHRAYLIQFENALRTVEGCEDVTLPYWDITKKPPDFLFAPPFDSYKLPKEVHPEYPAGYSTIRYDAQKIFNNVHSSLENIPDMIKCAMEQPLWSDFHSRTTDCGIESAHNAGHPACGESMAHADVAAFDPIFWFFHANWDRLWWEWQQIMSATTFWTVRSTITGSTLFLDDPVFNKLEPFELDAGQTIDLSSLDVGYAPPAGTSPLEASSPSVAHANFGSFVASGGMRVNPSPLVSVRLKDIERLAIPGSFRAILIANGQPIARRTFFQSTEARACENCRKNSKINLDFMVEFTKLSGSDLTVEIEALNPKRSVGSRVPLQAVGNPTLNVRMLLQEGQ